MKKLITLLLIAVVLLTCSTTALAYAGSAEDPLISKSFAQSWADSLLGDLLEQARVLMQSFEERFTVKTADDTVPQKQYALAEGSVIRMYEGASITVTEGTAKVEIISGEFVNVTVGGAAINGRLLPGHLYIVCENGEAVVTATAPARFNIEGRFSVTAADGTVPTATPSPTPVVTPTPTPVVTPSPTPVVTPSPTPVVTPSPTPVVTPSPTPVVTPGPTPVVTPTPVIIVIEATPVIVYIPVTPSPAPIIPSTPTPTPSASATPKPTASPAPTVSVSPEVTATPSVVITVEPSVNVTGTLSFKDVSSQAWFYNDLRYCIRMGLIDGISKKEFAPSDALTRGQAISVIARLHQLQEEQSITLKNHWFGPKWYKTYVSYAVENDLLDESYKKLSRKEMKATVTRGEFAELLYTVLPVSEDEVLNNIPDNAIPDVKAFSDHAEAIYALYRAGVLVGYTDTPGVKDHTFKAHETVIRSEAAVLTARMADTSRRMEFTIEN